MAQYTKRTCVNCGLRDIQPNMRQKEIYAQSGKSKKGFSGSTVVGSMLGNKKSSKSIADSILNNNQRTYYRKRKVWLCGNCYGEVKSDGKNAEIGSIILGLTLAGLFWLWVLTS